MPNSEYVAARCFKCATFQSMRRLKLRTFKCKLCNEKQSLKKIYAISDHAKDIRKVVQDLNMHRMVEKDIKYDKAAKVSSSSSYEGQGRRCLVENQISMNPSRKSKWDAYMPQNDQEDGGSEEENYEAILSLSTPNTARRRSNYTEPAQWIPTRPTNRLSKKNLAIFLSSRSQPLATKRKVNEIAESKEDVVSEKRKCVMKDVSTM
mmetsp:Transcript_14214/g.19756  ORF Transcript_14214/g.19756 Transcript_14214/m.19756 type:complete len:206 (+) Transcript_14214:69-686(+)